MEICILKFCTEDTRSFSKRVSLRDFLMFLVCAAQYTCTDLALKEVLETDLPTSRNNSTKIVILFTDGQSNCNGGHSATVPAAQKLQEKAKVISVGIGNGLNPTELEAVSSSGKYFQLRIVFFITKILPAQFSEN